MKWLTRLFALLATAVCSIFTAQWAVRRFYKFSNKYYTFTIGGDERNGSC